MLKNNFQAGDTEREEREKWLLEIISGLTQNGLDAINKEVCNGVMKIGDRLLM